MMKNGTICKLVLQFLQYYILCSTQNGYHYFVNVNVVKAIVVNAVNGLKIGNVVIVVNVRHAVKIIANAGIIIINL